MTTNWGSTTLLVHDLDLARDFYAAAFGFETIVDSGPVDPESFDQRTLHIGLADGAGLWLLKAVGGDALLVGRQAGGQPLGVLSVTHVDAVVQQAVDAGARLVAPPTDDGSSRSARVKDLYGNLLVLVQPTAGVVDAPEGAEAAEPEPEAAGPDTPAPTPAAAPKPHKERQPAPARKSALSHVSAADHTHVVPDNAPELPADDAGNAGNAENAEVAATGGAAPAPTPESSAE
jgi:predicted enzyme related to lactoylglutathione lyase